MKKNINRLINHYKFGIILFVGIMIFAPPFNELRDLVALGTAGFPDFDLYFSDSLGHRSIITHSILLPHFLYYYLIKKKKYANSYLIIFIISIYLGMGIHLTADFYPKSWEGSTLIKLPGNIDIGGLSVIWIGLNAMFSLYFAGSLLNKIITKKSFWILYLIIGSLMGATYSVKESDNEAAIFWTFLILFLSTFFYSKKINIYTLLKKKTSKNKDYGNSD